jgi:hypothetical protein
MSKQGNRVAWGLAVILALAVLVGGAVLFVRFRPLPGGPLLGRGSQPARR